MNQGTVWAVMGGGIVVMVYKGLRAYDNAKSHSRCVTGTDVVPIDVAALPEAMQALVYAEARESLPDDVKRDIELAEWEEDEDVTPVEVVDLDDQ